MKTRKTKIIKMKGDWEEVLDDCRFTVGKAPLCKEPSTEFKKSILIAEHSPIRSISIKWIWEQIPHWVGVHWVRHKWEKFVRTQREDRAGIPREELSQTEPQDFKGEANIQHQIDTHRKRLCHMASKETRELAEDFKLEVHDYGEEEIAAVLVPNCIYRCGCPELNGGCGLYEKLIEIDPEMKSTNIQQRYDAYNRWFRRNKEGHTNDIR